MLYNKLFASCVEQLLAGHFICPFAYPDEFTYLSNEDNFLQVDQYLQRIGKAVSNGEDESFLYNGPRGRADLEQLMDHFFKF